MGRSNKTKGATQDTLQDASQANTQANQPNPDDDTKPSKERGSLYVVSYEPKAEDGSVRVKQIAEVESTRAGTQWVRDNGSPGNTYGIARFFTSKFRVQQVTSTTIVNVEPA